MAKFWWQKGRGKRGIHWCSWENLCCLKENGGLGFHNLRQFNIALLAKHAKVLKAKYYPQSNFLEAWLGNIPSFTWKSIWASKELLQDGLCWRVGNGKEISIWNDCWIPRIDIISRQGNTNNEELKLVSDLIDSSSKKWKTNLVHNTFQNRIAERILQTPLTETDHADSQVWKGEQSGEFSVRSAYKLLQDSTLDPSTIQLLIGEDGLHGYSYEDPRISVNFSALQHG
ncbi:hypothetical protein J1N35_034057 [Gossypium stocksii]|uniref:Reverse transcriptase zinc-binding domain-containing protein n=1 Tax=Gossypium stocksii TaxID=47602 RepID=A0A9D3URB7_9ROSI|nr:hypothetical protein J1N35_034057 [Gossypium stocksii]